MIYEFPYRDSAGALKVIEVEADSAEEALMIAVEETFRADP